MADSKNPIEKELVDRLFVERKKEQRWRNARFIVWASIIVLYAVLIFSPSASKKKTIAPGQPYVALIRMNGAISATNKFSAKKVIPQLNKAFNDKTARGVVLLINSPGGSPVQASIIHDKIVQLKKKTHKKVVVLGEDALASGSYLVATAADKIFVNRDTLTGSIGVIMSGFGFTGAIQKLGITRRVFTAGTNKDRLDSFKPVTAQDKAKVHAVLSEVHQNFVNDVLQGRKGKLHGNKNELFSGDFWTGQKAVQLGLADGTANLWEVMNTEFGVSHYKNYSVKPNLWQALFKDVRSQLHLGLMSHTSSLEAVMQ